MRRALDPARGGLRARKVARVASYARETDWRLAGYARILLSRAAWIRRCAMTTTVQPQTNWNTMTAT